MPRNNWSRFETGSLPLTADLENFVGPIDGNCLIDRSKLCLPCLVDPNSLAEKEKRYPQSASNRPCQAQNLRKVLVRNQDLSGARYRLRPVFV